jgi:sulfur carrier protein
MRLTINGEPREFPALRTIQDLLDALKYEGRYFAVAVNLQCIPRSQYELTSLHENDSIEILSPMQGG